MITQAERMIQVQDAICRELLCGEVRSVQSTDCLHLGQHVVDLPDVDYTDLTTVVRTVSGPVQKIIETENTGFAVVGGQWVCLG